MVWLWLAAALAVLLLLLLLGDVKTQLYASRQEANDSLWVRVTALWGLVRLRYQVPVIKFLGIRRGWELDSQMTQGDARPPGTGQHQHLTVEKLQQIYADSKRLLAHVSGFDEWFRESLTRFHCTELRWETRVGLGDAPETAFAVGMLWSVKSSLLGFLFRYVPLEEKPLVAIEPQYNKLQFSTELSCIVKIRLGNAIFAGLLLLVRIMKVKGGLRAWQSILFKA